MNRVSIVAAISLIAADAALAGCSTGGAGGVAPALPSAGSMTRGRSEAGAAANKVGKDLFISDLGTHIEVLKHGSYKDIGRITRGIDLVDGIWVDGKGDLYAANDGTNNVTEYAPGGNSPACTYSSELVSPVDGTTDAAGNVYVDDFNYFRSPGYIDKYAQCRDAVVQQYAVPLGPEGVAVDKHGNLFVSFVRSGGGEAFEEFKKGSKKPTLLDVTTGPGGGITIDGKGNLISVDQANGLIQVIAPPYTKATTLVSGLQNPFQVALNKAETLLFCVNTYSETVTVYNYPSGKLVATIGAANGIQNPAGVADSPSAVF